MNEIIGNIIVICIVMSIPCSILLGVYFFNRYANQFEKNVERKRNLIKKDLETLGQYWCNVENNKPKAFSKITLTDGEIVLDEPTNPSFHIGEKDIFHDPFLIKTTSKNNVINKIETSIKNGFYEFNNTFFPLTSIKKIELIIETRNEVLYEN